MIWVDYVIIALIALSAVIGLARGLIREVLSLVIWVAAGAWVLGTASHPRLYGWGITAMGALVGERIAALLLAVVDGSSPSAWFSAATWLGVYLAVLFAAALPERVRGGRR